MRRTAALLTAGVIACVALVGAMVLVVHLWERREKGMHESPEKVLQYDVFEFTMKSSKEYPNPFADVTVEVVFKAPSGKERKAYAFHNGQDAWVGRIAPDEAGAWSYRTASSDAENSGLNGRTGSFECQPSESKGFIRVDPEYPYWFSYSNGSAFFGMGDTCYGMVNGITDRQRLDYLDVRSAQKINFVRFFASGYDENARQKPDAPELWAWGGTPDEPDYERFNPAFFKRLEGILQELNVRGMHAEIEVFNLYSMQATRMEADYWVKSQELCERWARYVVSRLSAYTTVYLWTVANEYEVYPDGIYRYQESDAEWARTMCAAIREADPYGHPTTVHPEQRFPGKIFGTMDVVDVITQQQNSYESSHLVSDASPAYWEGPGSEAGDDLLAERRDNKPVINTENGYCWVKDFPVNFSMQLHSVDKCRRTAWRIFASGGAAYAAGYAGTWHGRDQWTFSGSAEEKVQVPFTTEDMGLAAQLSYFYDFVTERTDFLRMSPANHLVTRPNLCLANEGEEYVIYAPQGGTVRLKLHDYPGPFSLVWFNPRTGESLEPLSIRGGEGKRIAAPDDNDWVLHLVREK